MQVLSQSFPWGPQFCISNKFQNVANTAGLQTGASSPEGLVHHPLISQDDDCRDLRMPSHHCVPQHTCGDATTRALSQSITNTPTHCGKYPC